MICQVDTIDFPREFTAILACCACTYCAFAYCVVANCAGADCFLANYVFASYACANDVFAKCASACRLPSSVLWLQVVQELELGIGDR